MSLWTQDLLRRAQAITAKGRYARLYFDGQYIVAKEVSQETQGIIEGVTGQGHPFAMAEEALVAIVGVD